MACEKEVCWRLGAGCVFREGSLALLSLLSDSWSAGEDLMVMHLNCSQPNINLRLCRRETGNYILQSGGEQHGQ